MDACGGAVPGGAGETTRDRAIRLLESVSDAVLIIDAAGRFTFVNDPAARLTGQPRDALVGREATACFPGLRETRWESVLREGLPSGRELVFEALEADHDRWIEARTFPLAGGGAAFYLRDVTDRHRGEETLRRREASFRRLAESGIVAVVSWRADGRIVDANDEFLRLVGRARAELAGPGLRFDDVTPPELHDADRRALETVLDHGWAVGEKEYLRSDGTRVPALVMATLVDGARGEGIALVVDLTERKRAEEFQRRLIGVAGHDLRTPLASIVSAASALAGGAELSERGRALSGRIVRSAARMRRIVDDLADYTRSRVGVLLGVAPVPVDLAPVLAGVVEDLAAAYPGRVVSCAPGGAARGVFDPSRMAQAVENLLVNALKHGRQGAPVSLEWRATPEAVVIEVHNEGEPIPPDVLATLFEPFRRGRTHRSDGLGLGLFVVREVVRAHGGTTEVRSAGGRTTFTLRVPVERATRP